jgi:hypothetical protein
MGPYHIDLMEKFVSRMRLKYNDRISFITYREIENILHAQVD